MAADAGIHRIIIAGGAGLRMGRNKALLNLDGRTSLERIAALRFGAHLLPTWVITGAYHEETATAAEALHLECCHNPRWKEGQTSSVAAGIEAAEGADYFLLHPVDLPLITQEDYDALHQAMVDHPGHQLYGLSSNGKGGHPLVFHRDFALQVRSLPRDASLRDLKRKEKSAFFVEVQNPWVHRDLDRPDDLTAARRHVADRGDDVSP